MEQSGAKPSIERKYVSDAVDMSDIRKGQLNLIYAPCGSGKTYFCEHELKEYAKDSSQDILYLAPTVSLREAFEQRGEDFEECELWNGSISFEQKQEGFRAMTYAEFGARIQKARKAGTYKDSLFWNDHSVICADELSQAVKQSHYSGGDSTEVALDELRKRIANKTNTVVTISATPRKFLDNGFLFFPNSSKPLIHAVKMFFQLEGYKDGCVESYHNLTNLLKKLDPSQRGMVYIQQVKQMEKAVKLLQDRGINAIGIFSKKSPGHQMGREQMAVARSLIKDEKIPDDVQVLFINAAYETGLNIRPEKSHLDYIVVHDKDEETQVQVRGRYRGDIGMVYNRKNSEEVSMKIPEDVIAPYLDRRLVTNDKKELLERMRGEIDLEDNRSRSQGWPTFKKELIKQGYEVTEGKSGNGRYSIISK